MRVLLVFHGQLPQTSAPTTGGALRASRIGAALSKAGFEVHYLSRAQDGPGGFASPAELVFRARALRPHAIVCIQPEEAGALGILDIPLVVDLYAPRLLEAQFEGRLAAEVPGLIRAMRAGWVFLASNPRQAWHWYGALALAGLDLRTDPILLTPLACGPVRQVPRSQEPVFVGGGVAWPWADPAPGLREALAHLDRRGKGKICWFGGPGPGQAGAPVEPHPRLEHGGWLAYDALLDRLASAWAFLDWSPLNPERVLASGFRHADCLSVGLPILCFPGSALAEELGEAGIVGTDIPGSLDRVLDDPTFCARAGEAAREQARGARSIEASAAALVAWLHNPQRHPRVASPLADVAQVSARAASAEARADAANERAAAAEAEALAKRQENGQLVGQVQELIGTTARLARALDEVAGFKREAIAVLGGQSELARRSQAELEREVGILRADIEKKNAELLAMDALRERLENDLVHTRKELARRKASWLGG